MYSDVTCRSIVSSVSVPLLVQARVHQGLEEQGHEGDEPPEQVHYGAQPPRLRLEHLVEQFVRLFTGLLPVYYLSCTYR